MKNKFRLYTLILCCTFLFSSCEILQTDLSGTNWRWEGVMYSVSQAWTMKFINSTQVKSWWGNSSNYYQTKGAIGTYSIKGATISFITSTTYSGTGSYTNKQTTGTIKGSTMTIEGMAYTKK
ncbi:MAG: hypothetical protein WCS03_13995 [Bacteroidota bacterium]